MTKRVWFMRSLHPRWFRYIKAEAPCWKGEIQIAWYVFGWQRGSLAIIALLLIATSAHAETRVQLPTARERHAASIASWVTVAATIALDTQASIACADRRHCIGRQGLRVGVTYGVVFATKLLVHRARPCAPDCGTSDNPNYSFFSGHTALAFSTIGGPSIAWTVPLAASTGALRVGAGKHWITDVLTGAGVGALVSRIR